MNRRRFFRAAASFVAGCAIGLGLRQKMESIKSVWQSREYEVAFISHPGTAKTFETMVFYDRHAFPKMDRSVVYQKTSIGQWIRTDESKSEA